MESTTEMTPPDGRAPASGSDDLGVGRGPAWLETFLADQLPAITSLRRRIHARPELSHRESETTAVVGAALRAAGIAAVTLPGGTGLVAEIGAPDGPAVGLRADMDALPLKEDSGEPFASRVDGVCHACGHDVHTAILVGAALALRSAPDLPGRVRLLFQPAEEVMDGSRQLIDAGALAGLDRLFALHCDPGVRVGQIGLRVGPITSATDIIEVDVLGPGGHTSRPHLTVDLVGALARVADQLPPLLARRFDPRAGVTVVWGSVHAGETFNVIPERGTIRGTLRVLDRAAWEAAGPLVSELVGQILGPTGARFEVRHRRGVPPVDNDPSAVAALRAGVAAAIGPDAVVEAPQSTGAEDYALLLDHVPGALARLGVWDGRSAQVDLHAPNFRVDERAIAVGVRSLVHTTMASLAGT